MSEEKYSDMGVFGNFDIKELVSLAGAAYAIIQGVKYQDYYVVAGLGLPAVLMLNQAAGSKNTFSGQEDKFRAKNYDILEIISILGAGYATYRLYDLHQDIAASVSAGVFLIAGLIQSGMNSKVF